MYTAKKRRQTKGVYGAKGTFTKKAPMARRRAAAAPGYTRNVGYYGRFGGSGSELKFLDTNANDAGLPTGGTLVDSIVTIAQGNSESQRDGRKCTVKSIHWRYNLRLIEIVSGATPAGGGTIRLIMYQDKQCNGTAANVLDILETNDYQSYRNLANTQRFNILMDKFIALNYNTLTSGGVGAFDSNDHQRNGSFNYNCNIPLEFNSTTGVLAELRSNNIGLLLMSSSAGVVALDSKLRIRFSG